MMRPVRVGATWFVQGPAGRIAAGPFGAAWQAFAWARRANRALGVAR